MVSHRHYRGLVLSMGGTRGQLIRVLLRVVRVSVVWVRDGQDEIELSVRCKCSVLYNVIPVHYPGRVRGGGGHCIAFGVCEILVVSGIGDACGGKVLQVSRNGVDVRICGKSVLG